MTMTVTIHPTDGDDARRLAQRLLTAAGPTRHDEIRTTTGGAGRLAFDVPDDLASDVLGVSANPNPNPKPQPRTDRPQVDGSDVVMPGLEPSGAGGDADSLDEPGTAGAQDGGVPEAGSPRAGRGTARSGGRRPRNGR
ncbi:hypothetical protein [Actinoplanes sp. NPDC051859]|uniref:hypothetical protein n=1 Tax=Actinoplanes sp. NPDC051859 TaxID=3363909 RepID=UPI0037BA112E